MAQGIAPDSKFDGINNRHLLKILQAYRSGWIQAIKMPRLLILVYVLQLCAAILITFPLNTILSKTLGKNAFLTTPVSEFDFVLFSDFINQSGDLFQARIDQSILMLGLFLLFYVFLTGGILETLVHRSSTFLGSAFWKGSGIYFGKLTGSLLFFGTIQVLILLSFIGFIILIGINPFTMESDLQVMRKIQWMIPVFLLLEVIVSMVHDHVKVCIVQHPESSLIVAIRKRVKEVFRRFLPALGLYLLIVGTVLLIALAGRFLISLIEENTMAGIWTALLISQIFILGRIIMKFVNYASILAFYSEQGLQPDSG